VPCTFPPVTADGGGFLEGGKLDLDPAVNPTPGFLLAVEVENFLGPAPPIVDFKYADDPSDFQVTSALVAYSSPGSLTSALPPSATFTASGTVVPGGLATASAVAFQVLQPGTISALQRVLSAEEPGTVGDITLQVSLQGTLTSGQAVTSGTLEFSLHVCFDCEANPLT
jgi:hypothetical protein